MVEGRINGDDICVRGQTDMAENFGNIDLFGKGVMKICLFQESRLVIEAP